jgi:HAD superfamily hydrolase (TIGR01509 family)
MPPRSTAGSAGGSAVDGLAAVLWDMDGTLIDSETIWTIALTDLATHVGGELSLPAREAMVGTNMRVSVRILFADLGVPPDEDAMAEAISWLGGRASELFAGELPWRPGAFEALAGVRAAGVPCALVTNTERALTELALNSMGRGNFEVTVCGDEVPHSKPAPDVYLRALELLGVAASATVAVEDSPTGVASAEAAGCTVLVVPNVVPVPSGERRVFRDSLAGLTVPELVELITRRAA